MIVNRWNGTLVRVLRDEALRESQQAFADRVGCSQAVVSKWENAGDTQTLKGEFAAAMDTVLRELDNDQEQRFTAALSPGIGVGALSAAAIIADTRGTPPTVKPAIEDDEVNRREFGTSALGLAALATTPVDMTAPSVAPELVDYFRDQLTGHYSADRFLGPLRLIPTAVPQYELLCDLADASTGSMRRDFWSVATGYAAFIGWLYQDAGKLDKSTYWHDVMLERAHRAHDPQLVGFALHNKAMLQADMKDGASVLDLTDAALQQRTHLCAKVQVLALQQAAHGTSLLGGGDAASVCDRLLDEAAELLNAVDDEYPWGACRTPGYIDIQRATVWTRLGQAPEAIRLWERIIPDIPVSESRDLGVFRARYAQALTAGGEPEQAVAAVAAIPTLAAQTGSARMRTELLALRERMQPWTGQPPGRALDDLLSEFREPSEGDQTWHHETRY